MCLKYRGPKPKRSEQCTGTECSWKPAEWSQCENINHRRCRDHSTQSGSFTKSRDVNCVRASKTVGDESCRLLRKPDSEQVIIY